MPIDLEPTGELTQGAKRPYTQTLPRRITTIALFLALIWAVYLADALLFHHALANHGVVPRTLSGLVGILFEPFLHASLAHVWSNSLGILMLGGILILRSEQNFWIVSILGALASGIGTWLIGRDNTVHIGASGVIFAYFGFLLFTGIFERRLGSLLLSLLVFFFWGGLFWSALPSFRADTISWEGHLSGLAGGLLLAKMLAQNPIGPRLS